MRLRWLIVQNTDPNDDSPDERRLQMYLGDKEG